VWSGWPTRRATQHAAHQVNLRQRESRHRRTRGCRVVRIRGRLQPTISNGNLRWKIDLGRVGHGRVRHSDVRVGPASSPIIWNGLVILQCDTQADSFVLALNAETGEIVWKTERDELPSWGTPTVAMTSAGPELVTNAANFIRGYDPRTARSCGSSVAARRFTAPTTRATDDGSLSRAVAVPSGQSSSSGRRARRPHARDGESRSESIVWSRTGRGSYMPTP
jgi:hypothetical protein